MPRKCVTTTVDAVRATLPHMGTFGKGTCMKKTTAFAVAGVGVAAVIAGTASSSGAATHRTFAIGPSDSIQTAVNNANPGDTIKLRAGVYKQSVTISKSDISLRGSGAFGGGTVLQPPTDQG